MRTAAGRSSRRSFWRTWRTGSSKTRRWRNAFERLEHDLSGCWSRRITREHRLVYLVSDEEVNFLPGRFHYD
ncbi:MAG: Txe/YoeB family addiction module toxin [Acidobacteria bacterium]|nr:Txe/YoeB family addiction module toxin [Acidobacteriota bacterium]